VPALSRARTGDGDGDTQTGVPGTDPAQAVEEIRAALDDIPPYRIDVRAGATHLPYRVAPDHPLVTALAEAHWRTLRR
jgi:hypothetical protein